MGPRNGVPKYVPQDALIEVGVNMVGNAGGKCEASVRARIFVTENYSKKSGLLLVFWCPGFYMDFLTPFEGQRVCVSLIKVLSGKRS